MNRKCEQIADALYNILAPPGGLLKDPKLPFDLRWIAGHNGVNLHVPGASPVYIALSMQATIDEQKEVLRLLQPRIASQGYQRYDSSLRFDPQQWADVLTALGPAEGDTPEEAAQLQKMGNLVRSMMGQNGPEALAAALAEMDSMKAAAASSSRQQ
jgi:hypothetical protein